jgi:23S rRNA pseudouridine1911/1915/1917 synthase
MTPQYRADEPPELLELRLVVDPRYDGWRLDRYIAERIPRLSRSRIQKMIHSQSELGGPSLRPASRVHSGQELRLLRPAPVEPDVPRRFTVLFRDDTLLAIDKPSGLPVHATARFHKNTLTAVLRESFREGPLPLIGHRLDRETSGLLLLGLGRQNCAALKRVFRERLVEKSYLAIVHGSAPDEGRIDLPLGPDLESGIRVKMGVRDGGLPSQTRFRTLERRGAYSLVEASPETGRQHQIRAHLCAIGHPVLGDKLYGQPPDVWLEYIETGWTPRLAERLLLPRQALHAAGARLPHPRTGEELSLSCPLAEDLQAFWAAQGSGLKAQAPEP